MESDAESGVDVVAIREELERIVSSKIFAAAGRSRTFLTYVVERTLAGAAPKEYEIAVEVLGRPADYDPEINATVRVEAGRLRQRLQEYYQTVAPSLVRIEVPKGGYAAVFTGSIADQVSPVGGEAAESSITEKRAQSSNAETASLPPWFDYRVVLGGALVILMLLLGGSFKKQRLQAGGPIRSLAVLPLKDLSGGGDQAYFAEGMTDALITDLAQTPNLRVVSRTSAMQVDQTAKPLRKIAAELDVDAVVEGTVVRSGNRIRITAQLIDARDDRHLWAESFEQKSDDVISLQDTVAREIALRTQAVLVASLGFGAHRPVNPAAYDAYLRGVYFLHRRDDLRSISYLTQATTLDPSYAAAHAELAEALASEVLLLNHPDPDAESTARAEAGRAIQLDPNSGEGYAALSLVEINYAKDWELAGQDLQKSLALNPNNSLAEMQMSVYLDAISKPEEAVVHMRRAVKLDPLSFFMNRHLGSALYFARHYDEALIALHRAAEMEPRQFSLVDNWLSRSFEMRGELSAAEKADLEGLSGTYSAQDLFPLRRAYQHAGWKAYQKVRARLLAAHPEMMCDQFEVGESYLRTGDLDRAFDAFERGMNTPCFWEDSLAVNPTMDKARADPRYAYLLRRAHMM